MKKKLKDCNLDDLSSFSNLCDSLVKHVKKTWNVRAVAPKGYKKYRETYEDFKDMDNLPDSINKFDGITDEGVSSFDFPTTISMPHIAYNDTNQGRSPLEVLIGACVSYGMKIEQKRNELENKKVDYFKILDIIKSGEFNHMFNPEYVELVKGLKNENP